MTEFEYHALADGANEAIYLSRLLHELQLSTIGVSIGFFEDVVLKNLPTTTMPTEIDLHLQCNNINAIKLAHNLVFHAWSKHIELHHHVYVREHVLEGKLKVTYLRMDNQLAEILDPQRHFPYPHSSSID